jgi:REP element-mobilizing transposase RayT
MKYDPEVHHRRSIRLPGYDYSQDGYYFITICTQNNRKLFGKVRNDKVLMNDAGRSISFCWDELSRKFNHVVLHSKIVMPNHLHGIIQIDNGVEAHRCVRPSEVEYAPEGGHAGPPLHTIVQWFKTITTNSYIQGVKNNGWPRFDKRLWQRNYYEHIIRTEKSLAYISEYIQNNPIHWLKDAYYEE